MAYEDVLTRLDPSEVVSSRSLHICWYGYTVATLTEETSSSGLTSWIIAPIWSEYDKCRALGMPRISGINDDWRCPEYVRTGMVPYFVRQRVWSPARPDISELLSGVGLSAYDEFEILRRTGGKCNDDDHYVAE